MIARLAVWLKCAGLFILIVFDYLIGDCFDDIELFEAWVGRLRNRGGLFLIRIQFRFDRCQSPV